MYRSYLRLKGCPKCGGDVLVDRAFEGEDVCLQCGFRNTRTPASVRDHPDQPTRRVAVTGERTELRP